jgi:hypothetical protein
MRLQDYFDHTFHAELKQFAESHPRRSDCAHCKVPLDRRVEVTWSDLGALTTEFAACFYLVTLAEEVLFTFDPEALARWHSRYKAHPIPVAGAGLGCVRALTPGDILRDHVKDLDRREFVAFAKKQLLSWGKIADFDPVKLFERLRRDSAFADCGNTVERDLLNSMTGAAS